MAKFKFGRTVVVCVSVFFGGPSERQGIDGECCPEPRGQIRHFHHYEFSPASICAQDQLSGLTA